MHHSHSDYYSDGAKLLIIVRWKIVMLGPSPASARENTRCQGEIFARCFKQMRFRRRRIMGIITASLALTIKSPLDTLVVYEYYWVYPGHEWRKQCSGDTERPEEFRIILWTHGHRSHEIVRAHYLLLLTSSRVFHAPPRSCCRVFLSLWELFRTSGWLVSPAPYPRRRSSLAAGWPAARGNASETWPWTLCQSCKLSWEVDCGERTIRGGLSRT